MKLLNRFNIAMIAGIIFGLAACGGQMTSLTSTENSDTTSSSQGTGTVIVHGGVGQSSGLSSLIKTLETQGSADEVLTRTYKVSLGDSQDCASANFIDIFDESSDTSDCVVEPTDTSLFMDITEGPEMGSNDAIKAGTYSCVKITMCDQLVWNSSDLTECPGTNYQDVVDPRDEASIVTFYYSTNGTFDDESANIGSADTPFLLSEELVVSAGDVTNLLFELSNSSSGNEIIAEYDSEAPEIYQCGVPAPQMTIRAE